MVFRIDGTPDRCRGYGAGLPRAVEALKGKAIYRVLLILPYAVPSFISILIFKGLFNQSFGEINMMLSALFGIKPAWFSDPTTARSMIIIVNTAGLSVHDDPVHGPAESYPGRPV